MKKGRDHHTKQVFGKRNNLISSMFVLFGFSYIVYKLPDLIVYNSNFPHPYDHALLHTFFAATMAWIGFACHKIKNLGIRFGLILMIVFVTYIALGNLGNFLWYHLGNI